MLLRREMVSRRHWWKTSRVEGRGPKCWLRSFLCRGTSVERRGLLNARRAAERFGEGEGRNVGFAHFCVDARLLHCFMTVDMGEEAFSVPFSGKRAENGGMEPNAKYSFLATAFLMTRRHQLVSSQSGMDSPGTSAQRVFLFQSATSSWVSSIPPSATIHSSISSTVASARNSGTNPVRTAPSVSEVVGFNVVMFPLKRGDSQSKNLFRSQPIIPHFL